MRITQNKMCLTLSISLEIRRRLPHSLPKMHCYMTLPVPGLLISNASEASFLLCREFGEPSFGFCWIGINCLVLNLLTVGYGSLHRGRRHHPQLLRHWSSDLVINVITVHKATYFIQTRVIGQCLRQRPTLPQAASSALDERGTGSYIVDCALLNPLYENVARRTDISRELRNWDFVMLVGTQQRARTDVVETRRHPHRWALEAAWNKGTTHKSCGSTLSNSGIHRQVHSVIPPTKGSMGGAAAFRFKSPHRDILLI